MRKGHAEETPTSLGAHHRRPCKPCDAIPAYLASEMSHLGYVEDYPCSLFTGELGVRATLGNTRCSSRETESDRCFVVPKRRTARSKVGIIEVCSNTDFVLTQVNSHHLVPFEGILAYCSLLFLGSMQ